MIYKSITDKKKRKKKIQFRYLTIILINKQQMANVYNYRYTFKIQYLLTSILFYFKILKVFNYFYNFFTEN